MAADRKKRNVTGTGTQDEDAALWARVTGSVTPNPDRAEPPVFKAPPAPPRKKQAARPDPAPRVVQPGPLPPAPNPKPASPLRHGSAPGVDKRTATKLQRGKLQIDATLDLHGMTRPNAEAALLSFIDSQQAQGGRCVLVITGRGLHHGGQGSWSTGVLRSALPEWLNQPPLRQKVLAFSYAQPEHGGTGAVYVLLKRAGKG